MTEEHRREIRTFVRRPGRMTASQREALQALAPRYCLPADASLIEPATIFGRVAPLLVEIGFGMGDSLVTLAAANPRWNVLGIEVHEPGVGRCLHQANEQGLKYFRVIMQDAVMVLRDRLPVGSVQRLNVYFPDPWPKKRHHKRRLINPPFLDLAARVL
ncbi:MAG: tRNA (guanosine(46)-N7)-methyltransferase TrmB, partial [Pseudomonadota bacterium]